MDLPVVQVAVVQPQVVALVMKAVLVHLKVITAVAVIKLVVIEVAAVAVEQAQ